MGLNTNTDKTVVMTTTPGYVSARRSDASYARSHSDDGAAATRAHKRQAVECTVCQHPIQRQSLRAHMLRQHGTEVYAPPPLDPPGADEPYTVSMPLWASGQRHACPVEGCPGHASSRGNMRKHFRDRHPNDLVIIPEEGTEPFPQCDRCGLQVSPHAVRMGHLGSAMCLQGQQLRRRRRAARLAHEARSFVHGQRSPASEGGSIQVPWSATVLS